MPLMYTLHAWPLERSDLTCSCDASRLRELVNSRDRVFQLHSACKNRTYVSDNLLASLICSVELPRLGVHMSVMVST